MRKLKKKPNLLPNSCAYQKSKAREGAILVQEVVAHRLGRADVSTVQQMFDESLVMSGGTEGGCVLLCCQ